jgi:hypothetical protein
MDWANAPQGPIEALREAAKLYGSLKDDALDNWVELIPIRYDDIFDRLMAKWADQAKELKPWATALGSKFLESGTDLLSKADSGGFIPAVGCDALLYKGFKLFAQRVQLHVAYEMAKAIAERTIGVPGAPPRFYVLAHSLGTAVAHDAIQRLVTESWRILEEVKDCDPDGIKKQLDSLDEIRASGFKPGQFQFTAIFQISNTSRLMHMTEEGPTESAVRPGAAVEQFFNVDHAIDPISKVLPFAMPKDWEDSGAGRRLAVRHFYQDNIHGFGHYLTHRSIHASLFRQLFRDDFRLSGKEVEAIRKFPDLGDAFTKTQEDRLRAALKPWLDKAEAAIAPTLETAELWLEIFRNSKDLLKIP